MERNKPGPVPRGSKAKITQQMPDSFIALGSKSGSSRDDSKRALPLPKPSLGPSTSASSDKLKREPTSTSLSLPPPKKLKVGLTTPLRPVAGPSGSSLLPIERLSTVPVGAEPWENMAIDCDVNELFDEVMACLKVDNVDKTTNYVLGIIKSLRSNKSKPCKITWATLLSVASIRPDIFTGEHVLNAMVNVLRRDVSAGLKGGLHKSNPHVHQMFLNLICHAFADKENWPDVFLKLYVEDAIGDRVIIDSPFAKPFVDNVITAFHTKLPPSSLLKSDSSRDTSSPLTINLDDEEAATESKMLVENWQIKTSPRYINAQEKAEQIVLEAIKNLLDRRQQPESISKNFVKLLTTASGLNEIRIIGVSRIEAWLHNHKLMKSAQELLAYLCYNCSASSQRDIEVISQLSKLRLKNKPMVNYFNNCLKEMVVSFQENLYPLLKCTIYNELSNSRNPNNFIVVAALFQVKPELAADALAEICLELLLNKDDYLRPIRALLKEINRVLRHEFNLPTVVRAILRERKELTMAIQSHECRERIFFSLCDIATMCMLLCISPQVRDAATQSKRDVNVLGAFRKQVSNIQRECVTWLLETAIKVFKPNMGDFHHALLKVLFLEQPDHYYKVDSWPGENERTLFLRLASEAPLLQTTLLRVLLIGISKETKMHAEVIEIVDQLVKRAAILPQDCGPTLLLDNAEILEFFFNLCAYNHPENITLSVPANYVIPRLAITNLYWKVWLILLILAAHNPLTVGDVAWNKYPTLRMLMEMCITNYFLFPPPTMINLDDDFRDKEMQIIALEKQEILQFEQYLAAATSKAEINEQTSLLLPQVMRLDAVGDARRPPPHIIEVLQSLNNSHKLGHLLCKSRNPDFLLDIMSRQGGGHMPWLADLVHSSEGVLAHLPVQCLCEYLLSTAPAEKLTKQAQLLSHLRQVVNGNDAQSACEVLEYLFRRLTSDHSASRAHATRGLTLILCPDESDVAEDKSTTWLSHYILNFAHFPAIKPFLVQFLKQALQIEASPAIVSSYMNFLATQDCYDNYPELNDLITDLSSVIIERHSVASYVLPGENNTTLRNLLAIFWQYTLKSKEHAEESYLIHSNYNNEYVIVSWGTGEQCAMQPLVIHAIINLMAYGPLQGFEPFDQLLNSWFPLNMDHPRAYSPDTSETTSYLPDWMKLRMIRSNVPRLVDAAIEKLEPAKLVLFIQSFGIPTNSISKLLNTLDKSTIMNRSVVVDAVLDKTYMIQLVEVQNKRGAVGGEGFVKAIAMQIPPLPAVDVGKKVVFKRELPSMVKRDDVCKEQIVGEALNMLFRTGVGYEKKDAIVANLIKTISLKKSLQDMCFTIFQSVIPQILIPTLLHVKSLSVLLRIILSNKSFEKEKVAFSMHLLSLLPPNNSTFKTLKHFLKSSKMKKEPANLEDVIGKQDLVTVSKMDEVFRNPHLAGKLGHMLMGSKVGGDKQGLVIDWLSLTEMENDKRQVDQVQVELIFSKTTHQFRPLLMSLLLQRASWEGLHFVMKYLLSDDVKNICPVSVLDYLAALVNNPKLNQGRDIHVPKNHQPEDMLKLNEAQVKNLVKFILEESRLHPNNWKAKMESRLKLLLTSIGNHAASIASDLYGHSNEQSQHLLLMIYMSLPYSAQACVFPLETTLEISKISCGSAIDKIAHSLLSSLAAPSKVKDWNKKSQDLELCARKLAATHPLLLIRHLPMVAGSLKGRPQYEWSILKSRGHYLMFTQLLGLMELLQPFVFLQTTVVFDLFESYFTLLQFHSQRELGGLVKRIVAFIQNWMVYDVKGASKFLQEFGWILSDIQQDQPHVRPLLTSVSVPTTTLAPTNILVCSVAPPHPEPIPERWSQCKKALLTKDCLNALQEIDQMTSKRPQLLESVAQLLYGLLENSSSAIRTIVLDLIIRWLKYNPKVASEALPAVLSCLDSQDGEVLGSVLGRLGELVVLMQEHAKIILSKVFQLTLKDVVVGAGSISKAIDLLNLQYGC